MFLDASIIVAIIAREPGWQEIVKRLEEIEAGFVVSPVVSFEAVLGLARKYSDGVVKGRDKIVAARSAVEEFLSAIDATEAAVSPEIGTLALDAAMTYGKAIGHPADLNFGDCFSYACAKALNLPLGYKGDDFALTDLA